MSQVSIIPRTKYPLRLSLLLRLLRNTHSSQRTRRKSAHTLLHPGRHSAHQPSYRLAGWQNDLTTGLGQDLLTDSIRHNLGGHDRLLEMGLVVCEHLDHRRTDPEGVNNTGSKNQQNSP